MTRMGWFTDNLRLVVVVPDEQSHTGESQQEFKGYDDNIYHNG